MTLKKKRLTIFVAVALVFTLFAAPAVAADTATNLSYAGAMLEMGGASSIQFALIEDDTITASGSADVYGEYTGPENVYGVGSVSKMYTAVSVMKLAEAGLVSLDTPVVQYIPEFTMADERYTQITVRMLLNHSSGLMGSTTNNSFLFDGTASYSNNALLESLKNQWLKADPGAYSVYCNDGFTLAELLVERVSGKSFTEFVHENICEPLGLEETFTPQDEFDASLLAGVYYAGRELPQETLGIIGAGGIYASAEDLALFGSLFYGDTVLSQTSLDAMAGPEYLSGIWPDDEENTLAYGLGWDNVELFPFSRAGIQALVKGGDTLGFHASLVVIPEYNMAAAVVSSGGASTYNQLLAARLLIDALAEKGVTVDETVPAFPEAKPAALPASELEKAGLYGSMGQTFSVSITEEGQMTIAELPGMVFNYMDDGSYRNETILFKLVEEEDGNIYMFQKAFSSVPGFPPIATADYAAQLLPVNEVSDESWAAWEQQSGKLYFMLNEVYTSQIYLWQPFTAIPAARNEYGYVVSLAVRDETTLMPVLTVPGMVSRDYQVIKLTEDGKYLQANDYVMLSQDSVLAVYAGVDALCTIQPDSYARWYSVGGSAGRQMTVTMPENSNFYVYDANGIVVASSIFGDSGAAELPEGGYMVFLGQAGARFSITIT